MTSTRFITLLERYLTQFRTTAEELHEARQLELPAAATEAAETTLRQYLLAYTWAVRSRALVLPAHPAAPRPAAELHTRLAVVEILVALRAGKPPVPEEADSNGPPPTPAQWQRLATAESRLFHLYQVVPLN